MPSLYRVLCATLVVCLATINCRCCFAQVTANGTTLSGSVEDPSGARVPHATVHIESTLPLNHQLSPIGQFAGPPAVQSDTQTDSVGWFSVLLPPGTYSVTVFSEGFRSVVRTVDLDSAGAGVGTSLRIKLVIAPRADEIAVLPESGAETSAEENQGALVLHAAELNTFSAEDSTFQNEVLSLAGLLGLPPQIYVDGFTGGRFPPKNTIRSVRINRNPYSAQYDALGLSRVEIDTLPGSQKLHGSLASSGTASALDAPDRIVPVAQPPYYIFNFNGNISGPLARNTSFFLAANYNDLQNNAAVNALGSPINPIAPLAESIPNPQSVQTYTARIDRQLTSTNTLIGRYEFNHIALTNGGVGLFVLPEAGYNSASTSQTLQLSDEQVFGAHTINQTRVEYVRARLNQSPVNSASDHYCSISGNSAIQFCNVVVQGVFTAGGNADQVLNDHQDHLEFQDHLSIERKNHFFRAGLRFRNQRDSNLSTANFNGEFVFDNAASYQAHSPTLASITTGDPSAAVSTGDLGFYVEDEWRARKNLTINYGFRFESQTAIPDHFDPAPRAGISWAVYRKGGRIPLVVLRGGAGVFYDRFSPANLLTSVRQNGILQQTTVLHGVDAQTAYTGAAGTNGYIDPTTYTLSPRLRSAYDLVAGFSAEHTFGRRGVLSINYLAARGVHQYLSRDVNAPEPGTYNPANPVTTVRPLGGDADINQFSSDGIEKTQLLYINTRFNGF